MFEESFSVNEMVPASTDLLNVTAMFGDVVDTPVAFAAGVILVTVGTSTLLNTTSTQ